MDQEMARDLVRLQTFTLLAEMLCGLDTPLLDYELAVDQQAVVPAAPHAASSALPMRYVSVAPRIESERSGERTPTARGPPLPKTRLDSEKEASETRALQVREYTRHFCT